MAAVLVLWAAFFVVNFNIAMMIPLLPFIQADVGLSPREAGLVLAAFPVFALVSNLALGPFVDRFGRRPFIIAGALACAALFLLTALARGAVPIILARAATGIFMPMVGASVFAAMADYVPAPQRARIAGYITSAAPVAFLAAMSLGVTLGGLVAWQLPLVALAAVALAVAIGAWRLPPTPAAARTTGRITARTYRNRLLSLSLDTATRLFLLSHLAWALALFVFLGLYPSWLLQAGLPGYGAGAIGALFLLAEVGGLFGALLAGRISRRFAHPLGPCAVASGVVALVMLTIPLGGGMALQATAYFVFAFSRDLMLALMLGGAMALVAPAERGSLNSIMNAIYQTGASLGGIASAWLYAVRPDFWGNGLTAFILMAAAAAMLTAVTRTGMRPAS
ncbi:MFS transporter [Roseococcus pinisoli]|uniref:MFS transporter n=1 Tax=Roseococcus pinisoli TaxID=2835040 RepID=A0ABS5Q9N9_9PROT|nr:MFS transporter [Roseococcus pinisoli]MBS7810419.1 MFS transporter [Roseococcus pinisoli]